MEIPQQTGNDSTAIELELEMHAENVVYPAHEHTARCMNPFCTSQMLKCFPYCRTIDFFVLQSRDELATVHIFGAIDSMNSTALELITLQKTTY